MDDKQIFFCVVAAGAFLPYLVTALIRWRRRSQELRAPESKRPNNYLSLREQALKYKRPKENSSPSGDAYVVMMDWAIESGIATVVAVSDGSASIYYSSGGGSIGGGYSRTEIRNAALHAVSIAERFLDHMQLTDNFPLPETGGVIFFTVTERGVFMARASVELLGANRHPLSELGSAMQTIITQYRLLDTFSKYNV